MIINSKEAEVTSSMNLNELMKQSVFLDIETTGLSRQYADIISITLLYYENTIYKVCQIFCQYKVDEPEALKYLRNLLKGRKFIITYNGNSFDIPFLSFKAQKYGVDIYFESFVKIDLYNCLRQVKDKVPIPDLKLKTAEEHFNIKRTDTLTGEDITVLYQAYRIEPRNEFSFLILQHNYEDVINLPSLMNAIFGLYDHVLSYSNLLVKVNRQDFTIRKNSLNSKFSVISDMKTDYIHPAINFSLNVSINKQTLDLNIPVGFYKDKSISEFYFIDNNDYKLKSYTAIEGIKKNLIPVKLNEKLYYDNMINTVKTILDSVFSAS